MVVPTLTGERVMLRAPTYEDGAALFAAYGDPVVVRYWVTPAPRSVADTIRLIELDVEANGETDDVWAICSTVTGATVGRITLGNDGRAHRRATVGFLLARHAWGSGIGGAALELVLKHAFGTLGLHRVEAFVDPRNLASTRLLQRLGFQHEGLLRDRWNVDGEVRSDVVFAVLSDEWDRTARGLPPGHEVLRR